MAFTAKLLKVRRLDIGWKVTVEFTDGPDVSVRTFRFSGSTTKDLKNFIRAEAGKLDESRGSVDFSAFEGKAIDLTEEEVTPTEPTAGEIAKAAWFSDWRKLCRLTTLAGHGLIESDDARIATLRVSLTAGWLNSYLGGI